MTSLSEALRANESFYAAFRRRDLPAMERLWARSGALVCIHPGWPILRSREKIIESWAQIMGNASAPEITCHGAEALPAGDAVLIVCYESLGESLLCASNLFRLEEENWRMVSHQAGVCHIPPRGGLEPAGETRFH